jgi:hypothetical protein
MAQIVQSFTLRIVPELDADAERLCRTGAWRPMACSSGRNSMSSAGWTCIVGTNGSELARVCCGADDSRRDGKSACMICMVRTADMVVRCGLLCVCGFESEER